MICPLISINNVISNLCLEEYCAWWNTDSGKCAILQLSKDLYKIEDNMPMQQQF